MTWTDEQILTTPPPGACAGAEPAHPDHVRLVGRNGAWEGAQRALNRHRLVAVVAGAALLLVLITNQVDLSVAALRIGILNANWEFSWSHDADTIILALGFVATVLGARRLASRRRLWVATAAILGLFFADEVSPLHAQIGGHTGGKLLYTPLLLGLMVSVWLLAADSEQREVVLAGLAILIVSFGMHVIGLHVLRQLGYLNWLYQAGVAVKEGTELAGLFLLVCALWMLARRAPTGPGT